MNWNGKRRWIALILVIASVFVMLNWPPVVPVIQLPGEVYPAGWSIFGLQITNTLAGSIAVWLIIGLLVYYVARNRPEHGGAVPRGGFYNLFELAFEGLYGFIAGIAPAKYLDLIFKIFMTIFIIVLLSNWMELVPGVDSIGFLEAHVHDDNGQQVALDGFETSTVLGIHYLNGRCPWVGPDAAANLSFEEQTARAEAGCVTGTGQAVPEVTQGDSSAVTESLQAEANNSDAGTVADLSAQSSAATGTTEQPAAETQNQETAAVEHEYPAGDPSVPWVVLPFFRAPSTDLNMTLALALIAVVMTQVIGFRALGMSYLTKFFNFGTLFNSPLGGIDVAVGLLELIGDFAKILSFAFRLLGNIFAGSILLFVMSFLVPVIVPWPFFLLEFFVGIIQALVFGLLTAIFMSLATVGHHGDEEHHAEEAEAVHA